MQLLSPSPLVYGMSGICGIILSYTWDFRVSCPAKFTARRRDNPALTRHSRLLKVSHYSPQRLLSSFVLCCQELQTVHDAPLVTCKVMTQAT